MRRPSKPFYIKEARRVRAVATPVRAAMIDTLEVLGPATILQVATALGYPPDGLYYHFAVLERHGLVLRVEPDRPTGAARYDVPGRPMTLSYRLGDRAQRRETAKVVAAMLRSAERSFGRAFAPGLATVDGPHRNLRAGRRTAWLTDAELARLNRYIERIHALFARRHPRTTRARLHEFTYVLAPIVQKGRRRGVARPKGVRS